MYAGSHIPDVRNGSYKLQTIFELTFVYMRKHALKTSPRFTAPGENFKLEFVVLQHFECEFLNVQPCCLDVVVHMSNCLFWRHIPQEIRSKSGGSDSNVQLYYP